MKVLDAFKDELYNQKTNYFIIVSGGHKEGRDFQTYFWQTNRNNKMHQGDVFLYRKSQSQSENGQFYIYGVGQIGNITGTVNVRADCQVPQISDSFVCV